MTATTTLSFLRRQEPSDFPKLEKRRFNRHPFDARGPRPAQVIDYAEGVGTGLRRYGGKFELFRDSLNNHPLRAKDAGPLPSPGRRLGLFAGFTIAMTLAACGDISITFGDAESKIKGSGVAASETRAVAPFTAIDATGIGKLKLRIGESDTLKITADDNILPIVKSEVKDGVLVLSTKGASSSKSDIVFEVSAKTIKRLENSGTVSIDARGFNGGELSVETSGVGSIKLAGRVDVLKVELSGVGSLDAENLVADRVTTELSGVGSATVRAEKSIRGSVSGVGSLTWRGAATDVSTNVSGIGRVAKG